MSGTEALRPTNGTRATHPVDVVIPCYNDGAFLRETMASLPAWVLSSVVVVNDGSTDAETLRVLQELRTEGVKVIDRVNGGLAAARNTGWQTGRAPHVLFLDADNQLLPGALEAMSEALGSDVEMAVAHGDREEFGGRTGLVRQPMPTLPELLVGNRIDACALVRRSVLEQVSGFDEAMRDGYEDWELWIRLMASGHRFVHVGRPTFRYRVRPGSLLSRADDPMTRVAIVDHVVRKHASLFVAHAAAVISALHGVQAHDRELLRIAIGRADGAERIGAGLKAELERSTARAEALEKDIMKLQVEHARVLADLEQDRENLAQEALRLNGEVDKVLQSLTVQREHARALQSMLGQYEERIRAMESSRLWRLRKQYYRMRALLRTSSDTSRRGMRWLKRITFLVSHQGRMILRKFFAKVFKALYLWTEIRPVRIVVGEGAQGPDLFQASGDPYHQFMARHFARPSDLQEYRENATTFTEPPLISVVMPVYDPPVAFLEAAIRSVLDQAYTHWELCIADDRSRDPAVRKCLGRWMKEDPRIKVVFRSTNGHISRASNSALELATGTFVALMDHDDQLAPDALYHIAKRLQQRSDLDIVYTDEDKVDDQGRHSDPHFKPQWCPDHLLSRNYFGHLVVIRRSLLSEVGGFRAGFEGSQDYDLLLRCTERTDRIARIPRVLYHWRIHAASAAHGEDVKPYAYEAARKALTEALERRGEPGEVSFLDGFRGYGIRFTSPLRGRVSIIIPTKDKADILRTCLTSLFTLTDHPDFEVLVVSNNSREPALFALFAEMKAAYPGRFDSVAHDMPFNFSELMNMGVGRTKGAHLLFLNNDTEVLHADWLRAMHEWSQRPSIGAVGVKLLYHNDTIQHGGVVIGLGGVAGHTFVGTHRDGPGYFNYVNTINNNSAVTAACVMVERAKLERIGGWDEAFTVEYNDVDLCLRLREAGFNNVYLPHVTLHHYESLTRGHPHMTRESYERHLREVGLFKARWKNYIDDDPCYNPNLSRGVHDWRFAI
jgi:glycosyltransferase involved in cell wall biosynthesis